jgi:hypothetical protein
MNVLRKIALTILTEVKPNNRMIPLQKAHQRQVKKIKN